MAIKRMVGVYGRSLVISAIATSLQGKTQFQVCQLEQQLAENGGSYPEVILFDLAGAPPNLACLLREHPNLTLIGVDIENHEILTLSGGRLHLSTAEELVQAIEGGCFG